MNERQRMIELAGIEDKERLDEFVWTPQSTEGLMKVFEFFGVPKDIAIIITLVPVSLALGFFALLIWEGGIKPSIRKNIRKIKTDWDDKNVGKKTDFSAFEKEVMDGIKSLPKGKQNYVKGVMNKGKNLDPSDYKAIGSLIKDMRRYIHKANGGEIYTDYDGKQTWIKKDNKK